MRKCEMKKKMSWDKFRRNEMRKDATLSLQNRKIYITKAANKKVYGANITICIYQVEKYDM